MSLLRWRISFSSNGPKLSTWWKHWLWWFVFKVHILSFQVFCTTWKTTWPWWSSASTKSQRSRLLWHDWTRINIMPAWSRDWNTPLPLTKTLSAFHFQVSRLLKHYILHCATFRACSYELDKRIASFYWWENSGTLDLSCKVIRTHKTRKTRNLRTNFFYGVFLTNGCFDYSGLPNNLPRDV